jgi:hypothetical protein
MEIHIYVMLGNKASRKHAYFLILFLIFLEISHDSFTELQLFTECGRTQQE